MKAIYDPTRKLNGTVLDFIIDNGGMIDGGKWQDIHTVSATQNFEIGTRLAMGDRVFRYVKSISDLTDINYAVINSHIIPTDGFEGAAVGVAGSKSVVISDTGAAGARPVNYYKGAFIQIYGATTPYHEMRRVVASTVGDGVSITLTLDFALLYTIGATVDVYPSIYSEIAKAGAVASGHETFVGYAMAKLTTSYPYGWVQTWGPVNGHYNQHFPGDSSGDLANDRDCVFNAAGEIITLQQMGTFAGVSYQRAGYILPCTKSNYGSVFIMLQLAP